VRALRRPTVSAWLVNQLARSAAADLDRLAGLGESLRRAQRQFAGDRLRELAAERRELLGRLAERARRLGEAAGQPVSAQADREVQATLEAALADPAAAAAVGSGRLAGPLAYTGIGMDAEEALAVPLRRPRSPGRAAAAKPGRSPSLPVPLARKREERAAAQREVTAARAAVREAEAGLSAARRQLARAQDRANRLRARVDELRQQLDATRAEQAAAARSTAQAERAARSAERAAQTARHRLATAEAGRPHREDPAGRHRG
jgi:hypothetical protein